jgi:hypothetical protein
MRRWHMLRFQRLAQNYGPSGSATQGFVTVSESVRPYRSSGRQVSVWLLNAETCVQFPGGSCSICDGQSDIATGFSLRDLRFRLPVRSIIPSLRRTHLSSGAGTIGPFGLLFLETLPHPTPAAVWWQRFCWSISMPVSRYVCCQQVHYCVIT